MSFSEDKAYRSKQGAGIVTYVKPLARNNAVFGKNRVDLAITFALKGCADSIRALLRVGRTYVDVFGGAIALAVVVNTVLNRAVDALDVLFTALSLFVHHNFTFRNFKFDDKNRITLFILKFSLFIFHFTNSLPVAIAASG